MAEQVGELADHGEVAVEAGFFLQHQTEVEGECVARILRALDRHGVGEDAVMRFGWREQLQWSVREWQRGDDVVCKKPEIEQWDCSGGWRRLYAVRGHLIVDFRS